MLYRNYCPHCGTDVFSLSADASACAICKKPFHDEVVELQNRIVSLEQERVELLNRITRLEENLARAVNCIGNDRGVASSCT